MKKISFKLRPIVVAVVLMVSESAHATGMPVVDVVGNGLIVMTNTLLTTTNGLIGAGNAILGNLYTQLYNLTTAITHNTGVADANAKLAMAGQQEMAKQAQIGQAEAARATKILEVSDKYQLAPDPCTTGEIGGAIDTISLNLSKANTAFGGGGGGGRAKLTGSGAAAVTEAVKEVGPGASTNREISVARTAKQHVEGNYCTAEEAAGDGTKQYCSKEGQLPNGDIDPETLFRGAGAAKTGKATRTFNDHQMTAVHAYLRNFGGGASLGTALTEKQARSAFGPQYYGMQKEMEQLILLSKESVAQAAARSTPQIETTTLMETILEDSPGSKDFYKKRAAAAGNYPKGMSWADFMDIDVMRRYGSPDWYVAISKATPDAAGREFIFMQAQANYLALENLKHQERIEIYLSALVASQARMEYIPKLEAKRGEMLRAGY